MRSLPGISKWSMRAAVLALAATVAIGGSRTIAADPPPKTPAPTFVVPPGHGGVGVQAAPTQFINGTLGVGGTACVGSNNATGCGSDYTANNELEVIGTSVSGGPVISMINNRPQNFPGSWWAMLANPTAWQLQDVTAGLGVIPLSVEHLAPLNTMVLKSSGRVGIGSNAPQSRLQVGPGTLTPITAGASLTVQDSNATAVVIKSTNGEEMFLYQDPNNGLMGTASVTPFGLRSNNTDRFWVTADGRIGIGNTFHNPQHLFQVGDASGAFTDGQTWSNASSRSLKDNFQATDDQSVLQKLVSLPVDTWNYKTDGAGIRHLGPTAEDFMAAFGLGSTDKAISTVDADGVAMAAIKGLYNQVQAKDAKIVALSRDVDNARNDVASARKDNEALRGQLATLDSRLGALESGNAPTGSARSEGVSSRVELAGLMSMAALGGAALMLFALRRARA